MLLEQRSGRDTPKSSFFSFVFTNVHGCRTFTACLTFYEPILPSAARCAFLCAWLVPFLMTMSAVYVLPAKTQFQGDCCIHTN